LISVSNLLPFQLLFLQRCSLFLTSTTSEHRFGHDFLACLRTSTLDRRRRRSRRRLGTAQSAQALDGRASRRFGTILRCCRCRGRVVRYRIIVCGRWRLCVGAAFFLGPYSLCGFGRRIERWRGCGFGALIASICSSACCGSSPATCARTRAASSSRFWWH
jgi:hypothetical protein